MNLGFSDLYYLADGKAVEKNESIKIDEAVTVYEVLKIVAGVALFSEDHIARLHNSLKMAEIQDYPIDAAEFKNRVSNLCKLNNKYFGNVELRVIKDSFGKTMSQLGFIPHKYPNPVEYINGVPVALMDGSRDNPNAKIKNTSVRLRANAFLKERNVFEVLLVNHKGQITEGSRSNVFFLKGNKVISAPYEVVLPGITRKFVIQAINTTKTQFTEELINKEQLDNLDAAFLSGTSLGIMPIKNIDNKQFDVHNLILRNIMLEFNTIVQNYLNNASSTQ